MSKLIFNNDEAEEKEISLSNINQLRSNKSNNSSNKELKQKFNSNTNIPKIFLKNLDKLSDKKEAEDNVEIKFERKSKKFHTIKQDIKPKLKFDKFNKMIRRKRTKTNRQRRKTLRKQKIELPKDEPKEEPIKEEELDEFNDKEIKTKLELILEKKFLPTETLLSYCKCQLYISYDYLGDFENTGLEGILCILVNRIYSNLYLQIYDVMDFKKQFEIELYTNILLNKGYEIASEKFHTIEFPTFCIGINFYTKKKAEEIKNIILNYSKALNSSLFYMYETKAHDSFQNTNIFDYILNPTKYINKNEGKKKNSNEANNAKQIINKNNNKTSDKTNNEYYFDQLFNINNLSKKLNYKISSDEQMLSFGLDTEANEVIFETSKGANRFFEHNNIDITMINEEYEKMKEKIKSKTKNNKLETRKTKKSYQEEIKDKENQDKINDILNQIEGLQYKDKNYLNFEEVEEKQKLNNKIKKFNIAKRLAINQKLKINSPPENMVFYEDDSERFEDEEEGEEEEDDEEDLEDNEESVEEEMNNTNENKTENNESNNIIQKGMKANKFNNIENKDNNNNLLFNSRISAIQNNQKNESEVSSNSFNENNNIKNDINNTNSNEEEKEEKSNTVNNKENDSNNKSNSADD